MRAEIETTRSGTETSERLVNFKNILAFKSDCYPSVKSLESQITDLENETEALSQSIETQKRRTTEAEAAGQKRVDDLSKELQKKVSACAWHLFSAFMELLQYRLWKSNNLGLN